MNIFRKSAALVIAVLTLIPTVASAAEAALPVRETLEAKGYEVSWIQDTKTVVIRNGGFVVEEAVGEEISLDYDTTYAQQSFFDGIEAQRKAYEEYSTNATVTEIGEGYFMADTEKLGEVMFRFDDKTHFHHEMNRMLYTAMDLSQGATLKVYFDQTMTASLPPQTYAIEVVFMNAPIAEETKLITAATVIEIGEGYILADSEKLGEVKFMVDENTNIHSEKNKMFYALGDVTEGMDITVTYAEAMTMSLPPQVYAYEVVIASVAEAEIGTSTTTGKITEIGEGYFLIESENGTVHFNVSEDTFYHHVMNRMLYVFESLEKDMEVEVKHYQTATFSLPPQMSAIEVTIK